MDQVMQLQRQIQELRQEVNNINQLAGQLQLSETQNAAQLQRLQQHENFATQQLQQIQQLCNRLSQDVSQIGSMAQQINSQMATRTQLGTYGTGFSTAWQPGTLSAQPSTFGWQPGTTQWGAGQQGGQFGATQYSVNPASNMYGSYFTTPAQFSTGSQYGTALSAANPYATSQFSNAAPQYTSGQIGTSQMVTQAGYGQTRNMGQYGSF